jgi:hypothetical protein
LLPCCFFSRWLVDDDFTVVVCNGVVVDVHSVLIFRSYYY